VSAAQSIKRPARNSSVTPVRWRRSGLATAVRLADAHKIRRLAVPALSMGIYGYPIDEAVPILVKTAFQLAPTLRHLQEIRFTVVDATLYRDFCEAIAVIGVHERATP